MQDYMNQTHFIPLPDITYNVRCLNGSAHIRATSNIKNVTCPLCLNKKTHKEHWQIVKEEAIAKGKKIVTGIRRHIWF